MPRRADLQRILVIGSGPIIIGQAAEFDYSGTQATKALKEEGYEVILVNSNPATIMTDPELADRTYIEPVTADFVELILAREKPDAVLLVDYPGFNLRMARRCKELGLRVVYYISPQLWAWRRGRVKQVARYVDRMIVIFPFEETFYREHGIEAAYVGHPLIEEIGHIHRPPKGDETIRIALLPGSRKAEVKSLLPAMVDAVEILARERSIDAYVVQAPTIPRELLDEYVSGRNVRVVEHDNGEAVAAADVALSSSGTATLECAVLGNDEPEASVPGEILPSREFYDYEAKYLDEASKTVIPAELTRNMTDEVRNLAVAAFKAIDCAGMARVDFLLAGDSGTLYLNELNTIPGFTTISMYSKMWEASGVTYAQLLDRLIALAIERHAEKQQLRTSM